MKCFGPASWCTFIEKTGGKLNVPDKVTVISLNPAKKTDFDKLVDSLRSETNAGKIVIISSTTPFEELKKDPLIGPYINRKLFVDSIKYSVTEYLRQNYPAT